MSTPATGKAPAQLTIDQLDNLLTVINNSVTIGSGTIPNSLIGDVLKAFNNGKPLQVLSVVKTVLTEGITLRGTTSFLGATGVTITATFDISGDFTLTIDVPGTGLATLLAPVTELKLPNKFDIQLPETWGIIQSSSGQVTFKAAALGSIGELLFQATRKATSWDAVAGLDLQISKLADLPALQSTPLPAFDSFVGLTDIMMVLSSEALSNFNFPEVHQFDVPSTIQLNDIKLPDQAAGGLVQGFNIYANLTTTYSTAFRVLANYLKLKFDGHLGSTLSVTLPNPGEASKLFVSVPNTTLPIGLAVDGTIGGMLENGTVAVFMTGTAKVSIQGQPVVFTLSVVELATGVLIEGSMQNKVPIQFTFEAVKLQLSDVALIIGIDDEEIPSFGFAATVGVGDLNGSVAVLVNSANPTQSMFLGAISGITLYDVAKNIAGQQNIPNQSVLKKIAVQGLKSFTVLKSSGGSFADALDHRNLAAIARFFYDYGSVNIPTKNDQVLLEINQKGKLWYLTDLKQQMHYQLTRGPRGAIVVSLEPQIYCVPQTTTLAGLKPFPQGLTVTGELDLYIARATAEIEVQGLTGVLANATLSKIVIGNRSFFSLTSANGTTGPQLSIATFTQTAQAEPDPKLQPPHIFITGQMTILGEVLSSVYLSVSENGVVVDINQSLSSVLTLALKGTISDLDNMALTGTVVFGFSEYLNLYYLGRFGFSTSINGNLSMSVTNSKATASLAGSFEFGGTSLQVNVNLDVRGAVLANLGATLIVPVTDAIVNWLKTSPLYWLNLWKQGEIQAIDTLEQAVGVLQSQWNASAAEVIQLLSQADYALSDIASVLQSVYELTAQQAASTLQSALNLAEANAGEFLSALQSAYVLSAQEATGILQSAFNVTAAEVSQLLYAAQHPPYDVDDIGSVLKSVYQLTAEAAATALQEANLNGDLTAQALYAAGYTVADIASALKQVYSLDASAALVALLEIPELATESIDDIKTALIAAGYLASDIDQGLHSLESFGSKVIGVLDPANW